MLQLRNMLLVLTFFWYGITNGQADEFPTYYGSYRQFAMHWYQQLGLYLNLLPRTSKRDYEFWLRQRPGVHRTGIWLTAPLFDECTAYAGYGKNGSPVDFDDPDAPSAWITFSISTKGSSATASPSGYFLEIEDAPWVLVQGSVNHWLPHTDFTMHTNIGFVFHFSGEPLGVALSSQELGTLFRLSGITLTYNNRTVNFPHDERSDGVVLDLIMCKQHLDLTNKEFGPWTHINSHDTISDPAPE